MLRVTGRVSRLLRIKLRAVVDTSALRLLDTIRAQGYPVLGDLTSTRSRTFGG